MILEQKVGRKVRRSKLEPDLYHKLLKQTK